MGETREKKQQLRTDTRNCVAAVSDSSLMNLSVYRLVGEYMSRFRRASSRQISTQASYSKLVVSTEGSAEAGGLFLRAQVASVLSNSL